MSKYSEDLEQQVVSLYEGGMKPTDVASNLGFRHHQPVYRILKRKGVYEYRKYCPHEATYELDKHFFEQIDSEEKAYCLGFIVADGYVDTTWYRVKIVLNQKDVDILYKIRDSMKSTHPVASVPSKNQVSLSINSKHLTSSLVSLGLTSNKSLTMDDKPYRFVPDELKKHFLRGYFDGDGCMTLDKKYSSGTKWSVQVIGTREFLLNTYDTFYPSTCKIHAYKSCDMHCWKLSAKYSVLDFLEILYADATIYLDRKYQQWNALM